MLQELRNVRQLALLQRSIGIQAIYIVLDEHRFQVVKLHVVLVFESTIHKSTELQQKQRAVSVFVTAFQITHVDRRGVLLRRLQPHFPKTRSHLRVVERA